MNVDHLEEGDFTRVIMDGGHGMTVIITGIISRNDKNMLSFRRAYKTTHYKDSKAVHNSTLHTNFGVEKEHIINT